MKRKATVVGGAGNVGATVARAIAEKELADVVIIDIADQKAAGIALDVYETCPILRDPTRESSAAATGAQQRVRHRGHHIRQAAEAGYEPRRSRARQLRNHEEHRATSRGALPRQHHYSSGQSTRCDGTGAVSSDQVPARTRHRHGRCARFSPDEHVHRDGAERLGRKRSFVRARRTWRHDGAARAL